MNITIAGAGLAGSLLAIFLARRGHDVTVHESRPDLRRVDISAGRSINLALANRGIDALRKAGVMDRVEPLLIPMRGRMLHALDGTTQLSMYGQTESEVIHSVSRGALNGVLMDAADATGRVEIRFESRWPDDADDATPVIGADGGGSAVRRHLVETHGVAAREELIAHGYKELTMPARDGAHAMERHALHIWPRGGYMLIALPNLDGTFTVTLFLPMTGGGDSFDALADDAAVVAFFERAFPDALGLMPDLARNFAENPVGRMGTVHTAPWHHGGDHLLIGDAAHAIVPFHGQGMNCAFEDCAALDACIGRDGDDWERVFAEFYAERKPNADAIAEMALENFIEMRDLVANPRFQLQKNLAFELERRHPGVFIPRYSMVMFHSMPYAEAQRRGAVQQEILDELTAGIDSLDDVDLAEADRLVDQRCRW